MKVEYDKYYQTEHYFGAPYPELLNFYSNLPDRGKLLDLGCGQGRYAIALARQRFEVTGIGIFQDLHANLPALQKALEIYKAELRMGILKVFNDRFELQKLSVPYKDQGLMEAFEKRKVPARAFITNTFITRKQSK